MGRPDRVRRASGRSQGFTLIELVVVLVIAGAITAVVPPLIANAFPGIQLKGAARELGAAMRYARNHALTSRKESVVTVDAESRRVSVTGKEGGFSLPEALDIKMLTAESESSGERTGAIRFFPQGGSTGGRITLAFNERSYSVDVDWLTGQVRVMQDVER